jgi:uncharacterized OB-fold protein
MTDLGVPEPVPESMPYWEGARMGELRMQRCNRCERYFFYPRLTCAFCHSGDVEWRRLSGKAKLLSYVINRRPVVPAGAHAAQVIAVVQVAEGPRMLTNIVGTGATPEELVLDSELIVEFEDRGDYHLPVFRLAEPSP